MNSLEQTIISNAVYYYIDINGNFIFDNWSNETQLLAMCLQEFYSIEADRLFYRKNGAVWDLNGKRVREDWN